MFLPWKKIWACFVFYKFLSPATCDVHTLIVWGTIWLWGFRIRSWSSRISINFYTGRKLCKLKNVENWCGHFSWFGLKQSWSLKNSRISKISKISIISKMFWFLVLKTATMDSTVFWSNHWNFFEIYVFWEGYLQGSKKRIPYWVESCTLATRVEKI